MPKLMQLFAKSAFLLLLLLVLVVPPVMAQSTLSPKGILAFWLSPELDFNGDGKGNSLDLGDLISPALPDLIVVSSQPLGEIKPGVTPTGFSVEIENIGKATAIDPQNVVAFRLRKVTEGTDRGPIICNVKLRNINLNLDPGQTATFQGSGTELSNLSDCPAYEAGEYQLDTLVDSFKAIKEGNEENNSTITPFTVAQSNLPDLIITGGRIVAEPRVGAFPKAFEVTVKNQGDSIAQSDQLEITVDMSNEIITVCTVIETVNLSLQTGQSHTYQLTKDIDKCPGLSQYENELFVIVDSSNQIEEENENNNRAGVGFFIPEVTSTPSPPPTPTNTPTPQPEIDLTITSVSKLPNSIQAGSPLAAVIVDTLNDGQLTHNGQALTYSISVQRTPTSAPLCSFRRTYSGLRIGPKQTHRLSIDSITSAECGAMSAGQRILRVKVDPDNTVAESNDNNNTTDHTFTVTAGPTPTPRPTNTPSPTPTPSVDFRILSVSHLPANVPVGGRLTNINFFIYNNGQGSYSGPLDLQAIVYQNSISSPHCTINKLLTGINLGVNASSQESITVTPSNCPALPNTPGTFNIRVTADPNNTIPEIKEDNNFDTHSFTTYADNYDLVVSDVGFLPGHMDAGDRITRVFASIANEGFNTLSAPTLEFEFRVIRFTGGFGTEEHCRFLKYASNITLAANGGKIDDMPFDVSGSECRALDREDNYRLVLTIDSDNRVQEAIEDNNLGFWDFDIPRRCNTCGS